MMQIVPRAIAQTSLKPKAAPACAAVVSEPTSRKPPTLVTMPSEISSSLFIAAAAGLREAGTAKLVAAVAVSARARGVGPMVGPDRRLGAPERRPGLAHRVE